MAYVLLSRWPEGNRYVNTRKFTPQGVLLAVQGLANMKQAWLSMD